MAGEDPGQRRRWLARAAFWLGVGLLVFAALRSVRLTDVDRTVPADQDANGSVVRTIRVKTVDSHPSDPNWREIEQGDLELIAGETTSVAAQDLPTERPLVLNLSLPVALTSAGALSARVISMDGSGELKLPDAVVEADRNRALVHIESGWLSPGRYRIEIQTTERSEFARRHYLLEVL